MHYIFDNNKLVPRDTNNSGKCFQPLQNYLAFLEDLARAMVDDFGASYLYRDPYERA